MAIGGYFAHGMKYDTALGVSVMLYISSRDIHSSGDVDSTGKDTPPMTCLHH